MKKIVTLFFLLGFLIIFHSCFNHSKKIKPIISDRTIKKLEQKKIQELFANTPNKYAWALFSYGGWSDQGQLAFLTAKESCKMYYIPEGLTSVDTSTVQFKIFDFDTNHCHSLTSKLETFEHLKDFTFTSFDSIQYQFVVFEKVQNQVILKQRIFFDDPSLSPETTKEHSEIIKLFHSAKDKILKQIQN